MANTSELTRETTAQSQDLLLAETSEHDVVPLDVFVRDSYQYLGRVTRRLRQGSVLDERV